MKCKFCISFALIWITMMPLFSFALSNHSALFSEELALTMIFGNYERSHRISVWENMKIPSQDDGSDFWDKRMGIVSSVLFQPFEESGKEKFFLVMKTVPVGEPFECHACLPLLSAAVFVYDHAQWRVESKNLFLMFNGEYATSPDAKLIHIGNKHCVELGFKHWGNSDGVIRENVVLMPDDKKIKVVAR